VIISTPQEIALMDARKGVNMFTKVDIPILGMVQNMAYFTCKCGEKTYLFGKDGVRKTAEKYGVPLLGELPLETAVQETSDAGKREATFLLLFFLLLLLSFVKQNIFFSSILFVFSSHCGVKP
jgi:hypothetical protein